MKGRQANKRIQGVLQVRAVRDQQMTEDLRDAPHRFKVFHVTLDECAKCGKPRAEHLPEDKRS